MYKYLVVLYTGDGYVSIIYRTKNNLISEQKQSYIRTGCRRCATCSNGSV